MLRIDQHTDSYLVRLWSETFKLNLVAGWEALSREGRESLIWDLVNVATCMSQSQDEEPNHAVQHYFFEETLYSAKNIDGWQIDQRSREPLHRPHVTFFFGYNSLFDE